MKWKYGEFMVFVYDGVRWQNEMLKKKEINDIGQITDICLSIIKLV